MARCLFCRLLYLNQFPNVRSPMMGFAHACARILQQGLLEGDHTLPQPRLVADNPAYSLGQLRQIKTTAALMG